MSRRILDETTKSTFASDDYLYMDGQTDGSSKITPDNLVRNTTVAQQLAQHIADAEDEVEQITADIEGIQTDINDVKSDIGDLEDLETTDKSSLVAAINEAASSGGGGSIDTLTDVELTNLSNGQALTYDSTEQVWKNVTLGGGGLTEDVKVALLSCFRHTAFLDDDEDYYGALYDALYPPANLVSISAVYTQSGTVYNTDSLDDLKADLVVTAHWSNGTTSTVASADYTLSGTLVEGTSTVTVSYGGQMDTFDVTVTHKVVIDYSLDALDGVTWMDGYTYNGTTGILTATSGEHCTEKFSVQDITYQLSCSDGKSTYIALFIWDENGNYLGREEKTGRSMNRMQLKPDYQYAVKIYNNTGTFDSGTVTMLPADKRATAVEQMSIVLADYLDDMSAWNNGQNIDGAVIGEINVSTVFPSLADYSNVINRVSVFSALGESLGNTTNMNFADILKTSFYTYSGTRYFHIAKKGITTLADLKSYIVNNNITIEINY